MDVDIVVLWVDGNDPAWQAEKRKYSPKQEDDSNSANRFRDWGLMKYWFRGIEKYAPWFRTLHFVTWGHVPPFLDINNPRLHIVRHEEYLPPEALPCFNSQALEMNLHRIKGLAEHFIYFNDDMFMIRPMKKEQFFDEKTQLPRSQFCEIPLWLKGRLSTFFFVCANSMGIINKWFPKKEASAKLYFGKFCSRRYPMIDNIRTLTMKALFPGYYTGLRYFHSPAAYRKTTFQEIWDKEPDLLQSTTMNKFRQPTDVNQILLLWWQEVSGQFVPGRMDCVVNDINAQYIDRLCRQIENQEHDMICINDPNDDTDFEAYSARLDGAFSKILPNKCSFEKP